MKDKKYELTDNTIEYDGKTLYQIKALKNFGNVKTGYLGGYVEKEENLSHEGNCWVDDNAKVYNNAKISGNAEIYGNASVGDNAEVYDNTQVFGNAKVYGYAKVYGEAEVKDNAKVYGNAEIFGASCWVYNNAEVYDNAKIYGEADVFGNAKVYGNAEVYNKTSVCDNAMVYDNAKVSDWVKVYNDAQVYGEAKVYNFTKIGGEAKVYDNAKVYDYADVRDNAKVYGNAEVSKKTKMYGFTEVGGDIKIIDNVEVKENSENETKKYELTENTIEQNGRTLYQIRALKDFEDVMAGDLGGYIEKEENLSQEGNCWVSDEARVIDNLAKVYGEAEVKDNAKVYGTTKTEDVFHTYGDTKLYEEHCSEIVDKLKLQDELPNFQVISQKGVLYEKNSENNNITEIKNFVENLKGEEFWDNMSLKDIRNWKELRNDEVVSIVYESKDDRDNITLEEFTDYNDYAKDTVINALSKEYAKNPDTIESLKKDILDKVPNKEVVKEKVEVVKDIEKEHFEKEEKVTTKTFGYRSDF